MKDPAQLIRLLANTSFAMQLGKAAGAMSHEVRGSFDQGLALLKNPAGALIVQNIMAYADSLDIPVAEVMAFIALQELAHARLFAAVPWLMPRFEALIGKYARGITIDLDAMEEQLRDAPRHPRTAGGAGQSGESAGPGRGMGRLRDLEGGHGPHPAYRTAP